MAKSGTPSKPPKAPTPPKADPNAKDPNTEDTKLGEQPPAPNAPTQPPSPDAPTPPPATQAVGHVCLEPIKHNGKRHQPGDPIELTEDVATSLLEQQAIKPA